MKKIVLPGFTETTLSNRFITSQEDLSESIDLGNDNGQVFFLSFPPGTIRNTHTHEEIRLTVVRSGKMMLTVEEMEIELGAGDFVSTLPNVPHRLEVVGKEPLRLMEFVIPPSRRNSKTNIL